LLRADAAAAHAGAAVDAARAADAKRKHADLIALLPRLQGELRAEFAATTPRTAFGNPPLGRGFGDRRFWSLTDEVGVTKSGTLVWCRQVPGRGNAKTGVSGGYTAHSGDWISLSCASAALCVAADFAGNAMISTKPGGGLSRLESAHRHHKLPRDGARPRVSERIRTSDLRFRRPTLIVGFWLYRAMWVSSSRQKLARNSPIYAR
jgi:hypothetical protein